MLIVSVEKERVIEHHAGKNFPFLFTVFIWEVCVDREENLLIADCVVDHIFTRAQLTAEEAVTSHSSTFAGLFYLQ
jgi:hypothetical protein